MVSRWIGGDVGKACPHDIGHNDVFDRAQARVLHRDRPGHIISHRSRYDRRRFGNDHCTGVDLNRRGGRILKWCARIVAVHVVHRDDVRPRDGVTIRGHVEVDGEGLSRAKLNGSPTKVVDVPDEVVPSDGGIGLVPTARASRAARRRKANHT